MMGLVSIVVFVSALSRETGAFVLPQQARCLSQSRSIGRKGLQVFESGVVDNLVSSLPSALVTTASTATADEVAGNFFGLSLFPWLLMLYWLGHKKTEAPDAVVFGLQYLLLFVFGSIPAAIGSDLLFSASLADVDWLHGAAESLLAVTNCVVVFGFRDGIRAKVLQMKDTASPTNFSLSKIRTTAIICTIIAISTVLLHLATGVTAEHAPWLGIDARFQNEPENALSVATWAIHTSSLVEWLVALGLAWRYAQISGIPQWRGLTWGMIPLHTSGIVACTYHLLYNEPAISWLVTLQAALTCLGNSTMAFACFRLASAQGWTLADGVADLLQLLGQDPSADQPQTAMTTIESGFNVSESPASIPSTSATPALPGWEDLGDRWAADGDYAFLLKLVTVSLVSALFVKYIPALVPPDLEAAYLGSDVALDLTALAFVIIPTTLNCLKWRQRSISLEATTAPL